MIKTQKRRLSKVFSSFIWGRSKRTQNFIVLIIYLFIPTYYVLRTNPPVLKIISLVYLITFIIAYLFLLNFSRKQKLVFLEKQNIQEDINTLTIDIEKKTLLNNALEQKIKRYDSLQGLTDKMIQSVSQEGLANILVNVVFDLIGESKGTSILYLLDPTRQELGIIATKKEDDYIIKAKQGDVFDRWVLRHNTTLLVEDIKTDFRFDLDKLNQEELRSIRSLISSPLISKDKFIGILRLDSVSPTSFSVEDLRLLDTISELGAISIENVKLYQHTQELAIKDSLTALYLRQYFLDRLEKEILRSISEDASFSILMLDIDHFKKYNDQFGHIAGDLVLKNIGGLLLSLYGAEGNIACRWGGEEFVLLLPYADKKQAIEFAEKLLREIREQVIFLRRHPTKVTVSIGVANFPGDCRTKEELMEHADKSLYKAKQSGRNRICSIS